MLNKMIHVSSYPVLPHVGGNIEGLDVQSVGEGTSNLTTAIMNTHMHDHSNMHTHLINSTINVLKQF